MGHQKFPLNKKTEMIHFPELLFRWDDAHTATRVFKSHVFGSGMKNPPHEMIRSGIQTIGHTWNLCRWMSFTQVGPRRLCRLSRWDSWPCLCFHWSYLFFFSCQHLEELVVSRLCELKSFVLMLKTPADRHWDRFRRRKHQKTLKFDVLFASFLRLLFLFRENKVDVTITHTLVCVKPNLCCMVHFELVCYVVRCRANKQEPGGFQTHLLAQLV